MTERVRDANEDELLRRIFPLLPVGGSTQVGPGDDAAIVAASDGRFLVSSDVLVENRHFRTRWSSGADVGHRAAAQNFADIAAMGGRPTALVISLVIPGDTPVDWVEDLARGLAEACKPVRAGVVGGDLASGETIIVNVTVHGTLDWRQPVLRAGARPGDVVAHAGTRGWSAAGLALLDSGLIRPTHQHPLVRAYLRPDPPLEAGRLAARAGATAMLDVSDGLLRDAGRIALASDVRLDLEEDAFADDRRALSDAALVVAQAALRAGGAGDLVGDIGQAEAANRLMNQWIWAGGEDHGLLATFPEDVALPEGWTRIGRVHPPGKAAPRVTIGGRRPVVASGWDHFGG
ncbi:thiamine-phosphate kinase [Myceligenerans pegani]|uniref:Thiamine-monophosphate kinase n=1 Tax=Myceligenerans pegani TaxID=2776917 RepID=A0ABR9N3A2_9MICO|nr:thiamine-phosphate kinase [Myceligenerans sp. TRM 65318]MBE1878128.1 thiamine-phosphate kinase [Myceligenerans sp. TRM 65318]MBE3020399.1 thiamine-phosphate kinase [Myceligenerans sp. TRM 65318]